MLFKVDRRYKSVSPFLLDKYTYQHVININVSDILMFYWKKVLLEKIYNM